ncbi:hypothetical protein [Deinococcus rufus]|uniref:Peptidoglycan bridge formation glycyltransferase FemA/FemB family protein n=1 Tax=Deinococcus rufus TaxID=2136097 RepID=A0ABV7ZC69_9DEIO
MIVLRKSRAGLPYTVAWFPDSGDAARLQRLPAPVVLIRQGSDDFMAAFQTRVVSSRTFCTVVTDLTQSEEALRSALDRTRRTRLKRALALEHRYEVGTPDTLGGARALIDTFQTTTFGHPVGRRNWQVIAEHGSLAQVSVGGQVMAAIAFLIDGQRRARMLYSATVSRTDHRTPPALISELNSALIWHEMLQYRALGIAAFDLGGLFDDPLHPSAGIDRFKLSFGGQRRMEVHALCSPYPPVRRALHVVRRIRPLLA